MNCRNKGNTGMTGVINRKQISCQRNFGFKNGWLSLSLGIGERPWEVNWDKHLIYTAYINREFHLHLHPEIIKVIRDHNLWFRNGWEGWTWGSIPKPPILLCCREVEVTLHKGLLVTKTWGMRWSKVKASKKKKSRPKLQLAKVNKRNKHPPRQKASAFLLFRYEKNKNKKICQFVKTICHPGERQVIGAWSRKQHTLTQLLSIYLFMTCTDCPNLSWLLVTYKIKQWKRKTPLKIHIIEKRKSRKKKYSPINQNITQGMSHPF